MFAFTVRRAERVKDQAVDGPEAAGHLESIDEIRVAGNAHLHAIASDRTYFGGESEPAGSVMHEFDEACGLEASQENQRCRASHECRCALRA
jgi:hypothetical protein